ncbi:hypothetical protein EJ04DRAFT_527219 [Polyplosphaeria fusca]|uniref:Uncharacterized protein n=1 Tax=Polyplosphaeria fusca TaxID=682080 RepID=A0A9P4QP68_9PLEO|nr:hypothetical protein EJ04DRAFT_527219 [Polyplosphaeria fusca]
MVYPFSSRAEGFQPLDLLIGIFSLFMGLLLIKCVLTLHSFLHPANSVPEPITAAGEKAMMPARGFVRMEHEQDEYEVLQGMKNLVLWMLPVVVTGVLVVDAAHCTGEVWDRNC